MRCLPESFLDATWRGTTNTDGKLIGISFNLADGQIIRLALPMDSAIAVAETLLNYVAPYRSATNAHSEKSSGQEAPGMDPIYCTDSYPRIDCALTIDVTRHGYGLAVFAPNGARLETYAVVKSPRAIARMVEEWCSGHAPRLRDRLDQSSGSSVTENSSLNSTLTDAGV